jgi:transcription initiation factor TFIIIB Brf1 subunit/transcription initiation factor TFIIB
LSHSLTANIIDFSHHLYSEVSQQQNDGKLSRGDNRDGLIAACLFYACKEYEVSRSPQEIGNICDVSTSDVTRGINLFYELMKNCPLINLNQYITKYSDFIERFCNCLNIDSLLTKEIMVLAKKVDHLKILIKNTPQAMACGCIFFITTMHNTGLTKTYIAEKCGISVPTITKSYERLLPYTQKLI